MAGSETVARLSSWVYGVQIGLLVTEQWLPVWVRFVETEAMHAGFAQHMITHVGHFSIDQFF